MQTTTQSFLNVEDIALQAEFKQQFESSIFNSKPIKKHLAVRKKLLKQLINHREKSVEFIFNQFPEERQFVDYCLERVKEIIIILGSPRGGTSAFKDLLAQAQNTISLSGEHRHLFTLTGLNFPDNRYSEASKNLELSGENKYFILSNLYYECQGEESYELSKRDLEKYAWDWSCRLPMQWPELSLKPEAIVQVVMDVCQQYRVRSRKDGEDFRVCLVKAFQRLHPQINPWYYDLSVRVLAKEFPQESLPKSPPSQIIIEVSPFILPLPKKLRTIPKTRPYLLLKASSDAFRIPQLRQLFAQHSIYYLHLTRNPLSAVNGLIDAWESNCFWQHNISFLLAHLYEQKSDCYQNIRFWCFDLFDGWLETLQLPLIEVCSRQWLASHHKVREGLAKLKNNEKYARFPFEPFQISTAKRNQLIKETLHWLQLPYSPHIAQGVLQPSVVSATYPPRAGRWKDKRPALVKLLDNPDISEMSRLLGYDWQNSELWI